MKQLILCGLFLTAAITGCASQAPAEKADELVLWNGRVPGALGTKDADTPTLQIYRPIASQNTGTAVVVCPGGGYTHLAMDHEGRIIGGLLRAEGITAVVLKYRLPVNGYPHPIPLLDAQRAIKMVRSKAKDWNIDPHRIGIMGFSAGGHLASTAGTHFNKPVQVAGQQADAIDAFSCRPDFMVLIYPVISMQEGITHQGSRDNLFGPNPPADLVNLLSNEKQVTQDTPPTFLVHADDDDAVPVENSTLFYQALHKAGVPAEMHIYLKGGHGFGTRPSAGPAAQWPHACFLWMQQIGVLNTKSAPDKEKSAEPDK